MQIKILMQSEADEGLVNVFVTLKNINGKIDNYLHEKELTT
jgi:hypothetical protein